MSDTIAHPPFTGIYNFRDIGRVVNTTSGKWLVREKLFYRAGRLDDASPSDNEKLISDLNLRTVIDLRTKSEHILQAQTHQARKNRYLATGVGLGTHSVLDEGPWETIRINFIGREFELNVLRQLKWWQMIWFLTLMLLQFRMAALRILGRNVLCPKGLLGLSKDSLRFCQAEIREALEVFTDVKRYPVLINCTQGKDRTGLVVMLVLFAIGVPIELVRADYSLSNEGLAPIRASMIEEVEAIGMDAAYTLAPPEAVDTVWNFLQEEYGGVDGYLDAIGFGEPKRHALQKILLEDLLL
ncbi:protein-tyrosine phosphatase-like protein [Mycena belliarum]|uniref:Protein-tyrosine phosphatase-like protein n=1 Tax=Mycena belliarum TaxID=1033014 RepID=A0AAD6ULI2_9AGAR|nr:protein-tyrosine phosphatase-like protein [Mycena belliae]